MNTTQIGYDSEIFEKGLSIIDQPTYREILLNKFNEITTIGFTIDEFQKAMVFLCLVRFIVYSIKYNPITSFKICAIGSVSCFLWAFALNDCVRNYYSYLKYWRLLTRIEWEDIETLCLKFNVNNNNLENNVNIGGYILLTKNKVFYKNNSELHPKG